jgi:hypothetical protein
MSIVTSFSSCGEAYFSAPALTLNPYKRVLISQVAVSRFELGLSVVLSSLVPWYAL